MICSPAGRVVRLQGRFSMTTSDSANGSGGSTNEPGTKPPGLIQRVKALLMQPRAEWPVIEREATGIGDLYRRYALLLAAIPALALFVRSALIGYGGFGFHYRASVGAALGVAISQYVMALVSVAALAFIADFVVTKFDGAAHRVNAFKLAVYSSTAAWLAGIFVAIPGLGLFGLLGLYSFYLLYTGLPVLMKVPQDKAMLCTIAIAAAAILLAIVVSALLRPATAMFGGIGGVESALHSGGEVTVPGLGTIDTARLEEAGRKLEEATQQNAHARPVDSAQLRTLLPETLGGYRRVSIETRSMGAAGVGGAQASADYERDGRRIRVELTDMAAAGALAGLGAAFNVTQEREDDSGFERTRTENGRMVRETWDATERRGSYAATLDNRFLISVSGDADSFEALKAIAAAIDPAKLTALAR